MNNQLNGIKWNGMKFTSGWYSLDSSINEVSNSMKQYEIAYIIVWNSTWNSNLCETWKCMITSEDALWLSCFDIPSLGLFRTGPLLPTSLSSVLNGTEISTYPSPTSLQSLVSVDISIDTSSNLWSGKIRQLAGFWFRQLAHTQATI